jgi:hypothetical protein
MARTLIGCALLLAFFEVAATEPPIASAQSTERCAVVFQGASGKLEHQVLPSLKVLSLAPSETFALPPDAPTTVKVVQCGRPSLVPAEGDYKVLAAGFPLAIVADDRVGVLEMEEGKLRFNMINGEMKESEIPGIQEFLNKSQEHFNKAVPSEQAPDN